MSVRYWLIDLPARIVTIGWRGYLVLIAGLALLCYVNVALALLFYALGIRLIWP